MTIAILAHDSRKELVLQFCTAQLSGEITVNWQAGGLVQHPAGGTGGDDSVPGQDTTVGGAELKCKFFAGIMCKNGNCHNSPSPLY